MPQSGSDQTPRVLILALHHGATHFRISRTLERALKKIRPDVKVEVIDALAYSAPWFRAYYNAYEIPLKYWPGLWGFIEGQQFEGDKSGPWWLYRRASRRLRRYIEAFAPHVVVATEVGLGEMAVIHKRELSGRYALVGAQTFAFERPWAQPEVDLFISHPGAPAEDLKKMGVPAEKILECGVLVDPEFSPVANRHTLRESLGLRNDFPVFLVNFGGSGKGRPQEVVAELRKVGRPFQVVFIARKNEALREELENLTSGMTHVKVLGWVDNMQEWMAASDLLLSRAGGGIVAESLNCGLPLLVFDAPPGNEQRFCQMIQDVWRTGYWLRQSGELAQRINLLLAHPEELEQLRANALRQAMPQSSEHAAEAVLQLAQRFSANGK